MPSPKYVPKEFLIDPADFGRKGETQWVSPDETWSRESRGRLRAAQLQHRVAHAVREKFLKNPRAPIRKMSQLADALELRYGKLQPMLAGDTVMQLEDLGRLLDHFGHWLEPALLNEDWGKIAEVIKLGRAQAAERGRPSRVASPRPPAS